MAEKSPERKQVASNRRAFFDYEILEKLEAGIQLKGP
ncbi:SsrA-binding protein, partial [bacterium]|nr:SsrA-binding protein [bacterium]